MGLSDMSANWLDGGSGAEPQRLNNGMIYVSVPGLAETDTAILQLAVATFDLPKESNNVVQVSHLNENRKFAGRVEYGDVAVTLNDYVDRDTAGFVQKWRKMVYNPANGKIGWKRQYAGTGFLDLFGPNGQYTRTYNLKGVWPSGYDPGNIDQGSDDIIKISLTLTIDKATPAAAQTSLDYTTNDTAADLGTHLAAT